MVDKGVRNVVVTMGDKGVLWVNKHKEHFIKAHKVDAVDTTGAGDAFIGCFAHFYINTKNILLALEKATAYAALSVTKYGTQTSYPTKEEFEQFLKLI